MGDTTGAGSTSPLKPTGAVGEYELCGAYLPIHRDHLVMGYFYEYGASYALIFSSQAKLEDGLGRAGLPWDSVRVIDDPDEFLASFREQGGGRAIQLAMDLCVMPDGKVRFHEIVLPMGEA